MGTGISRRSLEVLGLQEKECGTQSDLTSGWLLTPHYTFISL